MPCFICIDFVSPNKQQPDNEHDWKYTIQIIIYLPKRKNKIVTLTITQDQIGVFGNIMSNGNLLYLFPAMLLYK